MTDEMFDKIDSIFDFNTPEWIRVKNTKRIHLTIDGGWQGTQKGDVTARQVVEYYHKYHDNFLADFRFLGTHSGDWRNMDYLANICLQIFKITCKPYLQKESKQYGMSLK